MITIEKWITQVVMKFFIATLAMFPLSTTAAEATIVKDIRIGSYEDYVRLVLEFDRPLTTVPSSSIDDTRMQINLSGIEVDRSVLPFEELGADIIHLDLVESAETKTIEAVFSFPPADSNAFFLTAPDRFIIDAFRTNDAAASGREADPAAHQKPATAPDGSSPEPRSQASASTSLGISPSPSDATIDTNAPAASGQRLTDTSRGNRLQQLLIVALILATSLIAILLVLLIWIDGKGRKARHLSWADHLPPPVNPQIEDLDLAMGKLLKTDLNEMVNRTDGKLAPLVDGIHLMHKKNTLLDQRLNAVIAAFSNTRFP